MNRILITSTALVASTLSAAASAQSVTVYGLLDVGVETVSKVGTAGSLWRMPTNSNSAPSRLGFRGTEDLGGGLKASFTLEMGLALDTGVLAQGGRGWGRQALVSVSGPFGSVSLGRQYTMTFWSGLDADIHGGGIYGTGSLDSYLPNARADNSIAYRFQTGGFQIGATYSLGRDAVNAGPSPAGTNCAGENAADPQACREWSAMVKYDTNSWGVALANDSIRGRTPGAAPDAVFGGLVSSGHVDSRLTANGWVKFGEIKVGGGVIRRSNDGLPARKDSDLWHIGMTMPLASQLALSAQVVQLRYKGASAFNATVSSVRATYSLSKRTAVFAQAGVVNNKASSAVSVSGGAPGSNPVAGATQTGVNSGIRHSF